MGIARKIIGYVLIVFGGLMLYDGIFMIHEQMDDPLMFKGLGVVMGSASIAVYFIFIRQKKIKLEAKN